MNYFASELKEEWSLMRQGRFTLDNLLKYVVENQIQVIPAKYYNDDAQVKYLDFGSLYTYCCHGSKELLVKRWLRERIAYVDSMMDYFTSQDDQVTIRMNKTGYVEFSVTPYIPLYFSVKWSNADGGIQTFKLKRGETKTFYYTSTTATDQEVIIYHAQYIKELDGLSNLRPSSCILANATKLNNVEIHSDKLYNVNVSNNKYLRRLDLSGCSTLGTVTATGSVLDVSQCKYLSYLNIYDTALTGVLLNTSGGSLKEIYYPKTIQEVQLIKQTLLETIGLPYGKNGSEIPTSLYTVNIQECPSVKKLNTSSNPEISKTWISMKYCQNLTIRNALDFEEISLDGFQRLKVLKLENMFKLRALGFDDMLPVGEASTLQYMGISYCPELIDITMNCTSNDYEITFANGALLNLSGATKLNSISSNCVIHGLETIVLPLTVKHLYFTSEYGTGYSSIKNIWSSRCCEINEEGVLPVAIRYEDQDYIGMDLQGMKLNDIDLGALVNIPRAINFDLSPTTVNPNFNINRDGVEYPYLQPEGVLNLSNYTESLARFFNGVDLDKLEVVVENPLPQTDLSYCFYNSSFSNENLLSPILSNVSNINNLDYCFYKTTIKSPNIVNNISFENGTMNYTFGECNNIKSLSGFTVSDKVTSSIGLFTKCPITSITNTSIKTNGSCEAIFKGCSSLVNVQGLTMPNTTNIASAFEECTKLTGMPFIEITDKITDISKLYYGCINIDNIDGMVFGSSISNSEDWINKEQILSANNVVIRNDAMSFEGWNNLRTCNNLLITSNVKTFENYFKDCINLTSITFNELSDFSNLVNMAYAFNNCSKLSSISINVPDKVINISYLFSGCSSLTDISGMVFGTGITSANSWYPPNLTTANNITIKNNNINFQDCSTLIECNNLTFTDEVTTMLSMFYGCSSLSSVENLTLGAYCNDLRRAFEGCSSLERLVMPELPDDRDISFYRTFIHCNKLKYLEFYDKVMTITLSATDGNNQTFSECRELVTLKNFKVKYADKDVTSDVLQKYIDPESRVEGLYWLFNGCKKLKETPGMGIYNNSARLLFCNYQGDITDFIIGEEVTDISYLFRNKSITHDIEIPSHIINCTEAFKGCTSMTHIHSNWKNEYDNEITATDCYAGCTGMTHIDDIDMGVNDYYTVLDDVPIAWGGFGFFKEYTGVYKLVIPSDEYAVNFRTLLDNKIVNWGDGTSSIGENTHTYSKAGTYVVKGNATPNYGETYDVDNTLRSVLTEVRQHPTTYITGFYNCPNLKYVSVPNCRLASNFVRGAQNLEYVDVTNCKCGDKWGNFTSTFEGCTNLTTVKGLDTLDFSTYKPRNFSSIFRNCTSLPASTIKICGRWDMSNAVSFNAIFQGCTQLVSLDLSGWNTPNLENTADMFNGCSSLIEINGISNLNVSKVSNMYGMFLNCRSLETLDLSGWVVDNVQNMGNMFGQCGSLTTLVGLENWNVSSVTNMSTMFNWCESLSDLSEIEHWDTRNVKDMSTMFHYCKLLSAIDLSNWNVGSVTNMANMFVQTKITDFSFLNSWNPTSLTNVSKMFGENFYLESITLPDWFKNPTITNVGSLFYRCTNLKEIHNFDWNGHFTLSGSISVYPSSVIGGCNALTTIEDINMNYTSILGTQHGGLPITNDYWAGLAWGIFSNLNNLQNINFTGTVTLYETKKRLNFFENCNVSKFTLKTWQSFVDTLPVTTDSYTIPVNKGLATIPDTIVSQITNKGYTLTT